MGDSFDKYFFPYAIIKEPNINNADLFRGLRKIWGKTTNPEDIIRTLDYYTTPFIAISSGTYPETYCNEVKLKLQKLYSSKSPTSIYPFVMKLLKEYELGNLAEQNTIESLEVIESFLVRRSVSGIEPTGLLALFRTIWNVTGGKPNKDSLIEAIKKRGTIEWPDDERFKTAILSRGIYSSHIIRYVIREYELSYGSDVPENYFWIEHIMPQTLNKVWKKVISNEEHQNVVHTWGNLIPLTREMNQGLSQSEYAIKRDEFKNHSVFASSRDLAKDYDEWNKDTILDRSNKIANWALGGWKK